MEATSGGFSSFIFATKTKLIVLSSLLGVGTIIYLTKNYLQRGQFLPLWSSGGKKATKLHPTIVGGKKHVVIKEEDTQQGPRKVFRRQRSRRSSRRSSVNSVIKTRSLVNVPDGKEDFSLNQAITELGKSVGEVEEILGLRKEVQPRIYSRSVKIENEINRLKQLLEFAQDVQAVTDKTSSYLLNQQQQQQQQQIVEEIIEVQDANDLESANYNEIVESIRNQKTFEDDSEYDSDLDSFISATESVDGETTEEIVAYEKKLKDLISKHSKHDFYMHGIEYLTHYGVPVRTLRTELLHCDNDVDFCVKVHCIRRAFKNLLRNEECRNWFLSAGKEMLMKLLKSANYDDLQFSIDFDDMIQYCSDIDNWGSIDEELSGRGVCSMNFYDIILDFMIMDSFRDLENPPSALTTAINNRWLSVRIKETALSTAIWTVIKTKKRSLQNPAGFFARFYDISMHLTPLLAWGFLGPVEELKNLCEQFKESVIGFLRDIFSTDIADYKSVQTLSNDIMRLAKKRNEELITMLS